MTKNVFTPSEAAQSPDRELFVPDFEDENVLEGLTAKQVMDVARWTAGALNTQIERRKQADRKAETDKLTGFKSKDAYDELIARLDETLQYHYVAEELDGDRRTEDSESFHISAAFIDLDNFGQVNKAYDMDEGDKILVRVAHSLLSVLRPGDEIYRRGGDEFVVFLRGDLKDEELAQIKQRLKGAAIAAVNEDEILRDKIGLGASVGIGRSKDGELASEFIKRIDGEMQEDKKNKTVKHEKHAVVTV
jgi:diguanylate cyclase (GGDEF)-like protein